jgi:peroxiredoxin Q/BCP
MKNDYSLFAERKASIIVIAPHDAEKVKKYWTKESLPYTGIPDPDSVLGSLYGQQVNWMKLGRMPALFIIDGKGKIAFAQYGKSMSDIPSNSTLIEILDSLN